MTVLFVSRDLGKTKIYDSQAVILIQQAVLSLEVAMHYPVLMNMAQSFHKHVHYIADIALWQNWLIFLIGPIHLGSKLFYDCT